jgi:anti-sigma factor RsiW
VAVGLGGGWFGHDLLTETVSAAIERAEPMSFADEAAQAHTFYVNSRFEVEMGADDQEALNNWLSERLGRAVFGPDLTANGYRLIGGRSLPAESGTVAQYVYDGADGTRLTLLVGEVKPGRKSAVGYVRHGEVGSFHWVEGPLSYALVGRIERDQLMAMAQAIHKQFKGDPIDRRAARPAPAPPPVAAPKPALKPETKPETKPEVVPSPSPAGPALPSPAVPDDQAQPKAS